MSSTCCIGGTSCVSSRSMSAVGSGVGGVAGRTLRRAATCAVSMNSGNSTSKRTYRLPLTKGRPCTGMPSSAIDWNVSGLMTSPAGVVTDMTRPSRCLKWKLHPHRASARLIFLVMRRSMPTRLNVLCSRGCTCRITSPGARPGSEQPASPRSRILAPCFMPCSTCTSNVFFSDTRHLPLQLVHWSPAGVPNPLPWHEEQRAWICCIMPGPSGRMCTWTPVPWHVVHSYFLPDLDPVPLHGSQGRLRDSDSFLVVPLYNSSSVTTSLCVTSSLLRSRGRPRPPPPVKRSKMSDMPPLGPPLPMPSFRASSPYWS
mmetsp:Transcript_33222/g.98953  ORF Transcript_33222/g.98953 Transcript_33222/m.98953 type:complete len:314 (-) Transcript_33222:422-1363(-)